MLQQPPVLPSLVEAFQQTLSLSSELRQLINVIPNQKNVTQAQCLCTVAAFKNSTDFLASTIPDATSGCLTSEGLSTHSTLGVHESLVDEKKALIIGISSGVLVALFVFLILIILRLRVRVFTVYRRMMYGLNKIHPQHSTSSQHAAVSRDILQSVTSDDMVSQADASYLSGPILTNDCTSYQTEFRPFDSFPPPAYDDRSPLPLITAHNRRRVPSDSDQPDLLRSLGRRPSAYPLLEGKLNALGSMVVHSGGQSFVVDAPSARGQSEGEVVLMKESSNYLYKREETTIIVSSRSSRL